MQINPIKNIEKLLKVTFNIQIMLMIFVFTAYCFSFKLQSNASLVLLPIPIFFAVLLYLSWVQYDKNKQQILTIDNYTLTLFIKNKVIVSCLLSDINRLEVQAYNRIRYIVIIDNKNKINKSSWLLNKGGYCIRIHDTKENRAFIQQIYKERIIEKGFITKQ